MRAVGFHHSLPITDPESLIDLELPTPEPTGFDVLVDVQAVSVNPVDVKTRASTPGTEDPAKILGFDAAGTVAAVGPDVTTFSPGDEVYYAGSIARPGTNQQQHLVDARIVGRKPASLSMADAAALPLTTITAWEALFEKMRIDPKADNSGRSILIIGGAGGVGSIAIQLAVWAGLQVTATASRDESREWVTALGATSVISHRDDLVANAHAAGHEAFDFILCANSTHRHWEAMATLIAPLGVICSIVEMAEPVNLTLLMNKAATFAWELMFTKSLYGTPDMDSQSRLLNEVADLVDKGTVRTTATRHLSPISAETLRQAHALVESGEMIGKVVISEWPEQDA